MSLDDLQAQLRGTLDQQFAALKHQYETAIAEARQQALAEAQQQAEERTARIRSEMESHIVETVNAARAETERVTREAATLERQAAEQRLRKELDRDFQQQLEHVINSVKRSAELERESEKRRAAVALDSERERASAELAVERERAAAQLAGERQRLESEHALASENVRRELAAERERLDSEHALAVENVRRELAAERERLESEHALAFENVRHELAAERERLESEHALAVENVRSELSGERERAVADAVAQAAVQARREAEQASTTLYAQARTEAYEQARAEAAEQARAEIDAVTAQAEAATAEIEAAKAGIEAAKAESDAARAELESELRRISAESRDEREQLRAEVEAARQRADDAPVANAGAAASSLPKLLAGIRELDEARTLTQALDTLLAHAAGIGRAALFVIDGDRLKSWKAAGIPDVDVRSVESSIDGRDLLARAVQAGQPTRTLPDLPAPPFARAPADRAAIGVPVMIGGRAVAVLYADHEAEATDAAIAAGFTLIESLARHASTVVALRTAMRTLDVLHGVPLGAAADEDSNDDQGAKRFARLLVSEIKLYNEAAVRAGRQQRDIMQRLGPEIDRARRLYEARVPASIGARHAYFEQELVQTLADGDAALLGQA